MSEIYLFDNEEKATLKLIELEEKEEEDYKQRGWQNTGGEFRMNEINIGSLLGKKMFSIYSILDLLK